MENYQIKPELIGKLNLWLANHQNPDAKIFYAGDGEYSAREAVKEIINRSNVGKRLAKMLETKIDDILAQVNQQR